MNFAGKSEYRLLLQDAEGLGLEAYTWLQKYVFNLWKPTGHVMNQQFNIPQLYALPTLFLCVLVFITEMKSDYCLIWSGSLNKAVCASSLKG